MEKTSQNRTGSSYGGQQKPGGFRPSSPGSRPGYVSGAKPSYTSSGARPSGTYQKKSENQDNQFRAKMTYINDQIKAPNIMIIDDEKVNLGVFPRRRALEMVEETGLDLVQIAYDPEKMQSTVRLTDYGKYMYQKGKDEKEKKKTQKGRDMKEIKLNYAIGDNDLALKLKKAEEILKGGDNIKIFIKLKGRERMYEKKAIDKLMMIKESLSGLGRSQYDTPKKEAQGYSIILFTK